MIIPEYLRVEYIRRAITLANLASTSPTAENIAAVDTIVTHESGWNPLIENSWDSNAQAGHPSIGLMQCIQSTFDAHKISGFDNIHDPIANMVAGIKYAVSRYGSLLKVPGVLAVATGAKYVGY